jgi:hypothetical protein
MTDKLFIVSAAVHYFSERTLAQQPRNIKEGIVVSALRHCNCYPIGEMLFENTGEDPDHADGFLTSNNTFVDRYEALKIATAAGQLEGRKKHSPLDRLMSEDIY